MKINVNNTQDVIDVFEFFGYMFVCEDRGKLEFYREGYEEPFYFHTKFFQRDLAMGVVTVLMDNAYAEGKRKGESEIRNGIKEILGL